MAYENIQFAKPNMEFVDGYFFTMDETRQCLIQKSDDGSIVSSYPCQTNPTYLIYTDNFDTNTYNPDMWTYGGTNGGFRDGKFWSKINSGASSGQTYLHSKFRAKGQFDIRIDYNAVILQTINMSGAQLQLVNYEVTDTYLQVRRHYNSGHRYYADVKSGGAWTSVGNITTTDTIGGMRFYRAYNSTTTTVYYKSGLTGAWVNMGSTSTVGVGGSDDVQVRIFATGSSPYPEAEFEFDNFYMSIQLGTIKSLQYDGTYFWTMQEILGTDEPVIRKWLVRNYVCEMVDEFIIENTTGNLYDSDAFAVEHYITGLSTSISGGDTVIHMNEYYDTVVTSGSVLSIGDNGDSNLEDVIVSNVVGTDITISGGLLYDHSTGTKVITSPSFFLFNNYTGTSSTSGSLMRFNASTGSYMTSDSMSEYKNVTAATFNRFQNILRGYDDASAVVFVKNTEARFRNMSDLLSLTDASSANDNFIGDDGSIPDITKWSITDGDPRIYDNALFCSTVADGYDKVRSNYLLTGDFDVQISGSSGNQGIYNYGSLGDSFTYSGTGGIPDTYKWTMGGNLSLVYLDSDTLYMATSSSGVANCYVNSTYSLKGNFDFQIDFTLVTYPSTNTWSSEMRAQHSSGTFVCVRREYGSSTHRFNMRYWNGTTETIIGTVNSTLAVSKFRLTRSGSTITGYYWTGSAWTNLGTSTGLGTSDVSVLIIHQRSTTTTPISAIRYDNFTINSVTELSRFYYLHGMVLTFPSVSDHWCEIDKRVGIDSLSNHMVARYSKGTTTTFASASEPSNDYMLRLTRSGADVTFYYKTVTSGIPDSTWSSLGTLDMYSSDCQLGLYLYAAKVTVSGSYFDDLIYNSGTIRYQSATIPYYGIMNIDNIRANGSTIIPVYDLSYSDGNLYRLQDEGTYYGVDNDWGTQYNYVASPVRSFIDAITIEAYPTILPADGRNISTINCVVLDQFSNGAIDKPITFTDNDAYGYVTINPKNTDNIFGTGQAITYYRAGVDVHAVTIQGTVTQYD